MEGPGFDNWEAGETREFDERYEVTESGIVDFGERFEPWVHHVDPEAADESAYVERLTAGTLHVCTMALRLLYDATLADSSALDTVAVERAWRKYQVLPGDSLGVRAAFVGSEALSETRATAELDVTVFEAGDDATVMTMAVVVAFERSTDAPDATPAEDR